MKKMVVIKNDQTKRGFLAFFATEAGRKFTVIVAGTTVVGLFLGHYLPQTFGLNFYKDFVQSYENGVRRPVPEKVLKRLEYAMEKLDFSEFERKFVKPFSVYGFDLFQAGSTQYKSGAIIGIPNNFSYNNADEIERSEVRFRDENINWKSESGKLLEQAIVLKEDEQIFGLSKSLLQCNSHRLLFNSIYPSLSFLTVYTIGHYLNISLKLFERPLSLRMCLYSILGLFGVGLWSFMKDYSEVTNDAEIDKQLSSLGPEFIDAGVRYYDKILKKNMALRELLKDNTYTAKGNVNYTIRQKSLPLTIRKSFFEEKWKEINEKSQEETN